MTFNSFLILKLKYYELSIFRLPTLTQLPFIDKNQSRKKKRRKQKRKTTIAKQIFNKMKFTNFFYPLSFFLIKL